MFPWIGLGQSWLGTHSDSDSLTHLLTHTHKDIRWYLALSPHTRSWSIWWHIPLTIVLRGADAFEYIKEEDINNKRGVTASQKGRQEVVVGKQLEIENWEILKNSTKC